MGFFERERDRLRAQMREQYPTIAAAVDACRAHGCLVEVVYAQEGTNVRGRASAFSEAWAKAGEPWNVEFHRLITEGLASYRRAFHVKRPVS